MQVGMSPLFQILQGSKKTPSSYAFLMWYFKFEVYFLSDGCRFWDLILSLGVEFDVRVYN